MRSYNIIGNYDTYKIDFLNLHSWMFDNNFVQITSRNNNPVGARITVRNSDTNDMKVLRYMSELSSVKFDLNGVISELWDDSRVYNRFHLQIVPLHNNSTDSSYLAPFNIYQGKSLPYKSHCSERVIYLYDDSLSDFQIFMNNSGSLVVNGTAVNVNAGFNRLDLTNYINRDGTFNACYEKSNTDTLITDIVSATHITTNSATINIEFRSGSDNQNEITVANGDIWKKQGEWNPTSFCLKLEKNTICDDFDGVLLKYYNCDGCIRYVAGALIEEVKTSESNDIYNRNETIFNYPRRYITKRDVTLRLYFDDISKLSCFTDLEFSPKIWFKNYEGIWNECSLKTLTLVEDEGETRDYEVEINILN